MFEDGDVPGEFMYNFHLNERKTPKNQLVKSSSERIPKSKTKITKNDQNKDEQEIKGMLPLMKKNNKLFTIF